MGWTFGLGVDLCGSGLRGCAATICILGCRSIIEHARPETAPRPARGAAGRDARGEPPPYHYSAIEARRALDVSSDSGLHSEDRTQSPAGNLRHSLACRNLSRPAILIQESGSRLRPGFLRCLVQAGFARSLQERPSSNIHPGRSWVHRSLLIWFPTEQTVC